MSRSSPKERSRVQDSGRHISTFRVVGGFGSWKHLFYYPHELRVTPLNRRFIGGKNSGRRLEITSTLIEVRKPTPNTIAREEASIWHGTFKKLERIRLRSNYLNRKKRRQADRKMADSEMTAYLEEAAEKAQMLRAAETEETDCRLCETRREEELGQLAYAMESASVPKPDSWAYKHFF